MPSYHFINQWLNGSSGAAPYWRMKMSNNTGGPAFPGDVTTRYPRSMLYGDLATGSEVVTQSHQGMTLRDYFAAKAMQGFCVATVEDSPVGGWDFKYLAEHAYRCADAMIAEREKE